MIVAVTPNPAVDITYHLDHLVVGDVNRVREVAVRPGGKGINVARVCRQWTREVEAVLPVGGANGQGLLAALAAEELRCHPVMIAGETRRTIVTVTSDGTTTGLYERGPELSVDEWQRLVAQVADAGTRADVVTISGSLPPAAAPSAIADLIRACRSGGALVIADTSGTALLDAAKAGADVLKPNAAELAEATGHEDWRAGARSLLAYGAGAVLVSRGSAGLAWVAADRELVVTGLPEVQGNTTGAGDAVVACLAAGLAAGDELPLILRQCAAAGAAAVRSAVAGEISADFLSEYLPDVQCKEQS